MRRIQTLSAVKNTKLASNGYSQMTRGLISLKTAMAATPRVLLAKKITSSSSQK